MNRCSFLKRWPVEILKISKIGKIAAKNLNISMSPCVNRHLFRRNSSQHSPLKVIPCKRHEQTAPSWIAGQLKFFNQQKQRNCSEKPEYLHESLCKSESVWTQLKPSTTSKIHPIQASWTDFSFLNRWSLEILQISKIGEIAVKNQNIFMSSYAIPNLFGRNSSARSSP